MYETRTINGYTFTRTCSPNRWDNVESWELRDANGPHATLTIRRDGPHNVFISQSSSNELTLGQCVDAVARLQAAETLARSIIIPPVVDAEDRQPLSL